MLIAQMADIHHQGGALHETVACAWNQAYRICADRGVDQVQVLGDLVEDANLAFGQSHTAGDMIHAIVQPILYTGIHTILLKGNHDDLDGHQSALACFEGIPEITVIEKPQILTYKNGGAVVQVACLPWEWNSALDVLPEFRDLSGTEFALAAGEYRRARLERIAQAWDVRGRGYPEPRSIPRGMRMLIGHAEIDGATNRYRALPPGSTHTFQMSDLDAIGADVIGFGHYHKPQMCYVGSLVQLGFGEEGNSGGFRIVNTETGSIEHIDVDAPRYYTVRTEEFEDVARVDDHSPPNVPWRPGIDRVKVRGERPPVVDAIKAAYGTDTLPPGVQFEAVVAPPPTRCYTDQEIFAETALEDLIEVWMQVRGAAGSAAAAGIMTVQDEYSEEAERVWDATTKRVVETYHSALQAGLIIPPVADTNLESIIRIVSIRLRNIGPHEDTFVEFPDGLFAITGRTGVGKTFVLEGILAAVWREFLYYPGDLYDVLPEGFVGDALVEGVFEAAAAGRESEPTRYLARHKIVKKAKSKKIESFLYRIEPSLLCSVHTAINPGECTAECEHTQTRETNLSGSGKEGDFLREVVSRFGDREKFVATVFQNQDDAGSLISMDAPARMEYARAWVGADRFDDAFEWVKAWSKERADNLLVKRGRLSVLDGAPAALAKALEDQAQIVQQMGDVDLLQQRANERHQSSVLALAQARTDAIEAQAKEALIESKKKEGMSLRAETDDLDKRIRSAHETLAQEEDLRASVTHLSELRAERDRVMDVRERWGAVVGQRNALEANRSAVIATINAICRESHQEVDRERARVARQMEDASKALVRDVEEVKHKIALGKGHVERLSMQLLDMERGRQSLGTAGCRPGTPTGPPVIHTSAVIQKYLPCPFIDRARSINVEPTIKSLDLERAEIGRLEGILTDGNYGKGYRDQIVEFERQIAAMRYPNPETMASVERAEEARLEREIEALQTIASPPEVGPIDEQIKPLLAAESTLGQIAVLRQYTDEACQVLARKSSALVDLQAEYRDLIAGRVDTGPLWQEISNRESEIAEAEKEMLHFQRQTLSLTSQAGGCAERVNAARKMLAESQALITEIEDLQAELTPMQFLQEFFSRKGVPQMLIDTAIPRINSLLADLMDGMSENSLTMWLATSIETKGGKQKEGLHIMVTDVSGVTGQPNTRDAKRTSGGQKNLLKKMLRLGIGMFDAERRGGHHLVYCVDEPTIGLDNDCLVPKMLGVIYRLTEKYNQVIVVDHNPALLCGVPQRLELMMMNGKTHVVKTHVVRGAGGAAAEEGTTIPYLDEDGYEMSASDRRGSI